VVTIADRVLRATVSHGVEWVRRGGRIAQLIPRHVYRPPKRADFKQVEDLAQQAETVGCLPLWEGYRGLQGYGRSASNDRIPSQVRCDSRAGRSFTHLAAALMPRLVVEVGTAFGVSGMYWLLGVRGSGRLLTFDPNEAWVQVARRNLDAIGGSYQSVCGTFEGNLAMIAEPIDMAFLDAIHTDEHVSHQFDLVAGRASPNAVILIDDVNFFGGDMAKCWKRLSVDDRVVGSVLLSGRIGILELGLPTEPGGSAHFGRAERAPMTD
jgi:predicted O-methyltransferase YrrM